jgi:hypothetical protein
LAVHKGATYPGEHTALIDQALWDKVHAILSENTRTRSANTRAQTPALLKGLIFGPTGAAMSPTHTRKGSKLWALRSYVDNAMVKALARAFRWRKILDTGVHATLEDLARAKGVAPSYVSRVLRLTLLAPEIVEAVLDGRQPVTMQLNDLLEGFPLEWVEQRFHVRLTAY